MKKYTFPILSIVFLVAVIALIVDTKPSMPETVKIGFVGPLTGAVAGVGIPSRAAAEIAIDELNSRSASGGRKFALFAEDGQCNAKAAATAGKKLIEIDHVTAIVGGLCSNETLAIAPLAQQAHTVLISYASSDPSLTNAGDYIFRNYPSDSFQGDFAARYAFEQLGKRAAVVYSESAATKSIQEVFLKVFRELGGEVLISEAVQQGSRDLRGVVAKVRLSNSDFVYAPTYTGEAVALLQELKESGVSIPILGNDAWQDKTIIDVAGQAAEGIRFVAIASPSAPEEFLGELRKRAGTENPAIIPALQAYDAVKMLAGALEKAGGDSAKLKDALGSLEYTGLSSPQISFDRNGDIVGTHYEIQRIKNGNVAVEVEEK